MMSGANSSSGDRGSAPNPTPNHPSTGSQFLNNVKTEPGLFNSPSTSNFPNCQIKPEPANCVKTEPGYFDSPSASNGNIRRLPSTSNFSNGQVKTEPANNVRTEPIDHKIVPSLPIHNDGKNINLNGGNKKKKKKSHNRKANTPSYNFSRNFRKKNERIRKRETKEPFNNNYANNSEIIYYGPCEYRNTDITGHKCKAILDQDVPIFDPPKANETQFDTDMISIDLIKNNLPPCNIKSVREVDNIDCNVSNFEWEKLVDDEYIESIDDNIKHTVDFILLPEDEYKRILDEVIGDLNSAFSPEYSENRWHCYGPYSVEIVHGSTAIDVYYECFPFNRMPQDIAHKLQKALYFDERFCLITSQKLNDQMALQVKHKKSGKHINISFSDTFKVRCSLLMKLFLDINPNLKYLTVYLDLVLKKYRTNEKDYFIFPTIFWLVVFFMQQKKLLPAVIDVRKAAEVTHYLFGWDCSLPAKYSYPTEPVSLYSLLLGFFNFYKDFDFLNYVICPYLGRVLTLSDVERLQLPTDEFRVYLQQIRNPDQINFRRGFVNLQDPTDLSLNLGTEASCLLNQLKIVCHRISDLLPHRMTEIEEMDCLCGILPNSIDQANYQPCDFIRYEKFVIYSEKVKRNHGKEFNQCHILEAVRKLMEFVFKLEQKSVVITQNYTEVGFHNCTRTTHTFPVLHFEYTSAENTWTSDYMKKIIPRKEPIRIYLRCEVRLQNNLVEIFAHGEAQFMIFLRDNFTEMLEFVLNHVVSP